MRISFQGEDLNKVAELILEKKKNNEMLKCLNKALVILGVENDDLVEIKISRARARILD
jgi:hypothetical protein